MSDVAKIPCPGCGQCALRIETRQEALPLGTFSLSGQQMKFATKTAYFIKCGNCGIEARGKQDSREG